MTTHPSKARSTSARVPDRLLGLTLSQYLVDIAVMPVPQRVTAEAAAAALAGTDLDYSPREAVTGLLASKRLINCLVASAGAGKTHAMAALARGWAAEAGGHVIGLTASENAVRVMAGEGLTTAVNIARFLGKIKDWDETRGHMPVYPELAPYEGAKPGCAAASSG